MGPLASFSVSICGAFEEGCDIATPVIAINNAQNITDLVHRILSTPAPSYELGFLLIVLHPYPLDFFRMFLRVIPRRDLSSNDVMRLLLVPVVVLCCHGYSSISGNNPLVDLPERHAKYTMSVP